MLRSFLLAGVTLAACARPPTPPAVREDAAPPVVRLSSPAEVTLFLTTELNGTIEPCGCTSDPLGDLARTAALVDGVRKEGRAVALLDGGSTLFMFARPTARDEAQERLKADLIKTTLPRIGLVAAGLGPLDLVQGPAAVAPPRHAANLPAGAGVPVVEPRIVQIGQVPVGVFGVVDPALVPALKAGDPAAAARRAIADLRGRGAAVVVALAHMPRAGARKLAEAAPGADIVLVGAGVPPLGSPSAERVGDSYLVTPGNQGQVLARVDLHVEPGGGALTDAVGPDRAATEVVRLDERIAKLRADLARWSKDKSADPAFLATSRDELARLESERTAFAETPLRAPEKGGWFVLRLIPIKKGMPCDRALVAAKQELDRRAGEANLASDTPPPAPPAGAPAYAGIEECESCHKEAVDFWRTTRHAGAWQTLERVAKHVDRYCVSCHVTGWEQPGGVSLRAAVESPTLRDVQCETCHGPASLHVDADGKAIDTLQKVDLGQCATRCHTPEHSDTFDLAPYLRDVVGKGHGAKKRASLGAGVTGRQLRQAALDKAGRAIGEGCSK